MDNLELALSKLPRFYDTENPQSVIYNLIKAIIEELDIVQQNIDKVNNMVGINDISGDELLYRWGSLLNIPRISGESDEAYRSKLKLSVTSLTGGTANAIRYAIAVGLGINSDETAVNNRIHVYDAWNYEGAIDKSNGNIVCVVDLDSQLCTDETFNIINDAINNTKSAGIKFVMVFSNYRMIYYSDLINVTYSSLDTIEYSKIGE
jgi:hypothetical protein